MNSSDAMLMLTYAYRCLQSDVVQPDALCCDCAVDCTVSVTVLLTALCL